MTRHSPGQRIAAGNILRPVETAGWSWAEGKAIGKAMRLALENGLPERDSSRLKLVGDALAWAVPQQVGPDADAALGRLQLRVTRPVRGRLSMRVDGVEVASRRISTRPERRILMSLPESSGPVEIVLEEE